MFSRASKVLNHSDWRRGAGHTTVPQRNSADGVDHVPDQRGNGAAALDRDDPGGEGGGRRPRLSAAINGSKLGLSWRAMLDWKDCPAVERVPERVSGVWVFKGTRIPVRALFENLEEGASVDDFLKWFPGVTRDQVVAVLAHAEQSLTPA